MEAGKLRGEADHWEDEVYLPGAVDNMCCFGFESAELLKREAKIRLGEVGGQWDDFGRGELDVALDERAGQPS